MACSAPKEAPQVMMGVCGEQWFRMNGITS
jgi:hypothetical protein